MNVYAFQAALHCADCARTIRETIAAGFSEDSDKYPAGTIGDGGGESDCPQHCDSCGCFLENPLTLDGYRYVQGRLNSAVGGISGVLRDWQEFYSFEQAANGSAPSGHWESPEMESLQ